MPRFELPGSGLIVVFLCLPAWAAKPAPLSPARIDALAAMLPESPQGMGRPITDRAAWEAIGKEASFKRYAAGAQKLIQEPIVEVADDAYLDYSRTGNRTRGQAVLGRHFGRLTPLVVAECIENQGRYLPAIEDALRSYCRDKSWVLPAHDGRLEVFSGKAISVDLQSSNISWNLATTLYWLGDKLRPEIRQLVRRELQRRTFDPYLDEVLRNGRGAYWHVATNNWNAVCTAGVVGAALASCDSRKERATFVAAAERSMTYFLSGFTDDGYCSEGMGYWNYGFGHFILLSETLVQATGGKVDLLADKKAKAAALFSRNLEILPGIYPAFADCSPTARPDLRITAFLSRRYGWGLKDSEDHGLLLAGGPTSGVGELAVYGFPNTASRTSSADVPRGPSPLRSWFGDAGILVCRPPAGQNALGVALKGGHNAEHHNHNDVGSFVVALGHATPLLDPGAEVYTARTFSAKRYDSNVLNSFGHPVPIVAGQLQRPGRDAQAKVLKTEFTDARDTLVLDIASAYPVKSLKKLVRTFIFSRNGRGSLRVVDEVEVSRPESFGTALITFSKWKSVGPTQFVVGEGAEAVRVDVAADVATPKFRSEEIKEDLVARKTPVRLGFDLPEPVTKATMTLTIAVGSGSKPLTAK
jgi:hypothetical protein